MRSLNIALALLVASVRAGWQTVYNSNFTLAYVQSSNGSLYNLTINGKSQTLDTLNSDLKKIASAPANSTLVIDNDDHLFAVWGTQGCNKPIEISQYNPEHDQWSSLAQSNSRDQNWHQDSQVVWLDRSEDTIYMYGGSCNGNTQSGFYSYDLNNGSFSIVNSHGGAMPRVLSHAQAISLDNYRTLILGGRQDDAWMSMQQIAVWSYGSWTFNSVGNSDGIDSRDDPLLLPMWGGDSNEDGSPQPVNQIMVLGGTVAGRAAKPDVAILQFNETQGWFWNTPDSSAIDNASLTFAEATIYRTLASVDSKSGQLSLYGRATEHGKWQSVNGVQAPKPTTKKGHSSGGPSTAAVAAMSTILPIVGIAVILLGLWWWWRKRRERRLFLLPNHRSMMQQRSSSSSANDRFSWMAASVHSTEIPEIPRTHRSNESGSIIMMDNLDGNRVFVSKKRRNLRVVNPDFENNDIMREGPISEDLEDSERTSSRTSSYASGTSSSVEQDPFNDIHDLTGQREDARFSRAAAPTPAAPASEFNFDL